MLVFAAATMNFLLTRNRAWETAVLLLVALTLLRPATWMDRLYEPYTEVAATRIAEVVADTPVRGRLQVRVEGLSIEGDEVRKTVSLPLDRTGDPAARLAAAGLRLRTLGDDVRVERVDFGSAAERVGVEAGFRVRAVLSPASRPSAYLFYLPALLLLAAVVLAQRARRAATAVKARDEAAGHRQRGAR